jgi:hypothetical protein
VQICAFAKRRETRQNFQSFKMLPTSHLVAFSAAILFTNAAPQNYNNQPTPQNLFANGAFEYSSCGIGASQCYSDIAAAIAPWTLTSANKKFELISHIEPPVVPGARGNQWALDLNSDAPYTIGQTVPTNNGQTYTVKFQILKNGGCNRDDKDTKYGYVQATVPPPVARRGNHHHDAPPPPAPNTPAHGAMVFATANSDSWLPVTYTFTATSSSTLIEIGSTSPGMCGIEIDNVTMV